MVDQLDSHVEQEMDGSKSGVQRDRPEPEEARKALVSQWSTKIRRAKKFHKAAFTRMREDQIFAWGQQWPEDVSNDRYVANITQRHLQQRVASLYAKNPTAVAKRRERMDTTVWDGSAKSLQMAVQALAQGVEDPQVEATLKDAQSVQQRREMLDKVGKTLELLYQYNLDEQVHPFKGMMKLTVRRSVGSAVGWVKMGFQRAMTKRPEMEARIADISEKLANIQRLAADKQDGEFEDTDAQMEELRLAMKDMEDQSDIVVREGLVLDYPTSTAIIPDTNCRQLREFLGCGWVAQEYILFPEEIQEI